MRGVKEIADRYIERDGSDLASKRQALEDFACIAAYLAWQDPNDMRGGRKAGEAMDALGRLFGTSGERLRSALRPPIETDETPYGDTTGVGR